PDQTQLPADRSVVERELPAVTLLRPARPGVEEEDHGDPQGSHCPSTFPVLAAAAACFFFFFFLRRVVPYVPRKILPRLVRMSPLPMKSSPSSVTSLHPDRKSTRLNSSHRTISYAVFCLKKKKQT